MLKPEEKKELISGNEEALKKVYLSNYFPVFHFVTDNNGSLDEARDVYTEAFLYFLQLIKLRDFPIKCSVETLIYSIGRRIWLEKLKSKHIDFNFIKHRREFVELGDAFAKIEEIKKQSIQIGDRLAVLGEPCRTIVLDVVGRGKKMEELSERMGFSTIDRAWGQLAKCLKTLYRECYNKEIESSEEELLKLIRFLLHDLLTEEEMQVEVELRNNSTLKVAMLDLENLLEQIKTNASGKNILKQLTDLHQEVLYDNYETTEAISDKTSKMNNKNIYLIVILLSIIISGITSYSLVQYFNSSSEFEETIEKNADVREPNIPAKVEMERALNDSANHVSALPKIGRTAFAITRDGYFLTSFEGLSAARSIKLVHESGEEFNVSVAASREDKNLALLHIAEEDFKPLPYLPFRMANEEAALGQEVFSLGFPQNLLGFVNGDLNATKAANNDDTQYRISFKIDPASPGAPLISSTGNIIGMLTGPNTEQSDYSNALKSVEILSFLEGLQNDNNTMPLRLSSNSYLYGKTRTAQIALLKPYIFKVKLYY